MEESQGRESDHILKALLKIDRLCFEKCLKNYEKAPNIKEEACLSIG